MNVNQAELERAAFAEKLKTFRPSAAVFMEKVSENRSKKRKSSALIDLGGLDHGTDKQGGIADRGKQQKVCACDNSWNLQQGIILPSAFLRYCLLHKNLNRENKDGQTYSMFLLIGSRAHFGASFRRTPLSRWKRWREHAGQSRAHQRA